MSRNRIGRVFQTNRRSITSSLLLAVSQCFWFLCVLELKWCTFFAHGSRWNLIGPLPWVFFIRTLVNFDRGLDIFDISPKFNVLLLLYRVYYSLFSLIVGASFYLLVRVLVYRTECLSTEPRGVQTAPIRMQGFSLPLQAAIFLNISDYMKFDVL